VKRLLLAAAVVGAALLGGLLLRAAGPPAGSAPPVPVAAPVPVATPTPAPSAVPPPARDVFRYGDQPVTTRASAPIVAVRPTPTVEPPPPLAPPAPEPVRLVGFVRRDGAWRAALSIHGDVVVVGVGDASGGYEVLAIDEAEGVTVRDPQGQTRNLPLPPEP
jgi:hypothetical protein